MEPILFLAHTESDGTLARSALEALAAALSLGGAVTVGLVGAAVDAAARQIAGSGAVRFLAVEGEGFAQSRYATDASAAEALCRAAGASLVLAAHTSRWARAIPGAAARLNGRADTHATGIAIVNEVPAVTRWFYRQRMEAVFDALAAAVDRAARIGLRSGVERSARRGGGGASGSRGGIAHHGGRRARPAGG